MNHPMPTLENLRKARVEFESIEPYDYFYRSVTKLVNTVFVEDVQANKIEDLVSALMMLLRTWNQNYYRFFELRKPGMTIKEHFSELETTISKHFDTLISMRKRTINDIDEVEIQLVLEVFRDFTLVLGRVGAAKCLHLLAPEYFPLWDARILQGYGLERDKFRHANDGERYVEFINITKRQIAHVGDFDINPLKALDEYNFCRFTRYISFD